MGAASRAAPRKQANVSEPMRPDTQLRHSGQPRDKSASSSEDAAPSRAQTGTGVASGEQGLRIGDAAARFGVSARTLRYYEELGLLAPSGYTAGGERRYHDADLAQLQRILELREILGNLEEIKTFLDTERRLDDLRAQYRARSTQATARARHQQREILEELLELREALIERLDVKLRRMNEFRSELSARAARCRQLLKELA